MTRGPSRILFGLLLSGAAAAALTGCAGAVGLCAGEGCPRLPGCEDNPITCDPDHVCVEQICEGVGWICGRTQEGVYSWLNKAAPCDDDDPCTYKDVCAEGVCSGVKVPCDNPPDNSCRDGQILQAWESAGFCSEGSCIYSSSDLTCPKGCAAGQCIGAPCTGVKCDTPPSTCYKKPGVCVAGKCQWTPLAAGTGCNPGDTCILAATCDGQGTCSGGSIDCTRAHASGGTCVSGVCQGYACDSGWGNCNNTWNDGCELPLDTVSNCGGCSKVCGTVDHGSPSCKGGACAAVCSGSWADCDGKFSNGCEREVGVGNVCNLSGMASWSGSTPPCGTAHCGSSSSSKAKNFSGNWYCLFCSHCKKKPDGYYAWCLSSTGKFSPDKCISPSCSCDPNSSTYPQVCK